MSAYYKTSDECRALARAEDAPQARPLLDALRRRREELLAKLDTPRRSRALVDDCGGILCELRGVGFLFKVIAECQGRVAQADQTGGDL